MRDTWLTEELTCKINHSTGSSLEIGSEGCRHALRHLRDLRLARARILRGARGGILGAVELAKLLLRARRLLAQLRITRRVSPYINYKHMISYANPWVCKCAWHALHAMHNMQNGLWFD